MPQKFVQIQILCVCLQPNLKERTVMSTIRQIAALALLLTTTLHCAALPQDNSASSDSTRDSGKYWIKELSRATTPEDSMKALFNIFDLDADTKDWHYTRMLYSLAGRQKDFAAQLDIVRHLSNTYAENDSVLEICLEEVSQLSPSFDQRETKTYVRLRRAFLNVQQMSDEEAQAALPEAIGGYSDYDMDNLYERIVNLAHPTYLLANTIGGDMFQDYVDRLVMLADNLPQGNGAVKSTVYTRAANMYTLREDYAKAIHADSILLGIIDSLEVKYKDEGRIYRNLDRNRYICYRRMLYNYPALQPGQAQEIYSKLTALLPDNPELAADCKKFNPARAFYLSAIGRHSDAVAAYQAALAVPNSKKYHLLLLKHLIQSAEKAGDLSAQLEATTAYAQMLEEYNNQKAEEKLMELQLLQDINNIQDARNTDIIDGLVQGKKRLSYIVVGIAIVSIGAIAYIIITAIRRRKRKNRRH